jgi:large subunit ribosomal protein L17
MRHGVAGRKFDRPTDHRLAMFRNLVTDLIRYEKIVTTEQKAKEIRGMVEHLITLGKRGTLHARRQAIAQVYDPKLVNKLFHVLNERYRNRPGGYTRIIRLGRRLGDGAMMAQISLLGEEE